MSEIKDRVREERIARGLSQSGMAKLAGVKQQNIQQLEDGAAKRPRYLPELADALHVQFKWLLTGEGPRQLKASMGATLSSTESQIDSQSTLEPSHSEVLNIIAELMGDASPRSRQILVGLAEAAKRGDLNEDDLIFIEQVANRIKR